MEHCSRFWGKGEGCFGIVWVQAKSECWIRNSTTSTKPLHNEPGGFYSALLTDGQMKGFDKSCPNADLSVNKLSGVDGMQYTTHCGKVISGFDGCFSGYPACWTDPYRGFYHTKSLEECLRICVNEQPLCRAVSFNPGLETGYANCFLKTGFSDKLDDPGQNMGVLHSATISQIDPIDRNCPASKTYMAQGSKTFQLHCGQVNLGTNITSLHSQNVTACMDACAKSDKKCIGIVFDSTLANGYKNCYLQNTTSVISDQTSATYAVLAEGNLPSSPGPTGNNGGSSKPKAWIAGPVIGALVALAILGAGFLLWRRRRAAAAKKRGETPHEVADNEYAKRIYNNEPASEIGPGPTPELQGSARYTNAKPAPGRSPHELPS